MMAISSAAAPNVKLFQNLPFPNAGFLGYAIKKKHQNLSLINNEIICSRFLLNNQIMNSRFLSRDSWRGRSLSQLSRIGIESESSNCFSINLVVVQNFI